MKRKKGKKFCWAISPRLLKKLYARAYEQNRTLRATLEKILEEFFGEKN